MNRLVYLGVGTGFDETRHEYWKRARRAIQSLDFELVRTDVLSQAESTDPDAISTRMRDCAATLIPLCFPDCSAASAEERRALVTLFEREIQAALALREISARSRSPSLGAARDPSIWIFPVEDDAEVLRGVGERSEVAAIYRVRDLAHAYTSPQDVFSGPDQLQQHLMRAMIQASPQLARVELMLSSTFLDLEQERGIVRRTLAMLGHRRFPLLAFEGESHGASKLRDSLRLVEQATAYLGILYARYGEAVDAEGRSLTELEYEHARKLARPRFFLLGDPHRYLHRRAQGELARQTEDEQLRLQELKTRVRQQEAHAEYENPERDIPRNLLEMLWWMARPFVDQQALPAPQWGVPYEAHPYALLDEADLTAREDSIAELEKWLGDASTPRIRVLEALGGMGKSAVAWQWLQRVKSRRACPAILWWSFYGRDARPAVLASRMLDWLPGSYPQIDGLSLKALLELVLERLDGHAVDYLFVFDGLERELRFYQDFDASKQTEGLDLEELLTTQVKLKAPALGLGGEEAARRAMLTFHDAGTQPSPIDESPLAWFLTELAQRPRVRVLVTTRFVPTVLADLARSPTHAGQVEIRELTGLSRSEIERLWSSYGLAWEEDPLPDALGGFALGDLCADILGGYALPIVMLAELVASEPEARGSFRRWKASLPEWLRCDDWRRQGVDGRISARERVASIILHLRTEGLTKAERDVLDEILKTTAPVPHSDLMIHMVGPQRPLPTQGALLDALNSLRSRKIIGRHREQFVYEIHPRMRAAARTFSPDESPVLADAQRRLLAQWEKEDACAENQSVPFDVVARRFDELYGVLSAGARRAIELFDAGIEPLLRFRALGGVVEYRQEVLVRLLDMVDRLEQRASLAPNERARLREVHQPLRVALEAKLADNELLAGRIPQAWSRLERLGPAGQPMDQARCYAELERGLLAFHAAAWQAAEESLLLALLEGSRLGIPSVPCWAACQLVELRCGQGNIAHAAELLDRARAVYSWGQLDADLEAAAVELALVRRAGVAEALARHRASCGSSGLVLGSVACDVAHLDAEVRGLVQAPDERPFTVRVAEIRARAAQSGFAFCTAQIDVIEAEGLLARGFQFQAAHSIDALRSTGILDGWSWLRCRALLIKAEAQRRADASAAARRSAQEALEVACFESPRCGLVSEILRWQDTFCALGLATLLDQRATSAPAPDVPEPLRRRTTPGITNTAGWDDAHIRTKLEEVLVEVGWPSTTGSARTWWEAFERENSHRPALILRLAEELSVRKASITEFFFAYLSSSTDNIQANLSYLDYMQLKRDIEKRKQAAKSSQNPNETPAEWEGFATGAPRSADDSGREQLQRALADLKRTLDWDHTTGSARTFWQDLETRNAAQLSRVLHLAEELALRSATITEFFLASVYSNTDNIRANLHYLDYTRRKKEDEVRKRADGGI